jgi:hypothetical protein
MLHLPLVHGYEARSTQASHLVQGKGKFQNLRWLALSLYMKVW